MENLSVINAVTLLPSNKKEMESFVEMVKQSILNGDCNPLEMAKQISIAAKVFDTLKNDAELKDLFLTEAYRYSEKVIEYNGAKIEIAQSKSYEYCAEITHRELEIKRLKEIAKKITSPIADVETGEIINPATLKKDCDILKITIK